MCYAQLICDDGFLVQVNLLLGLVPQLELVKLQLQIEFLEIEVILVVVKFKFTFCLESLGLSDGRLC